MDELVSKLKSILKDSGVSYGDAMIALNKTEHELKKEIMELKL